VLSINGVGTLTNVIIIDPIQIDLVSLAIFSRGIVATMTIQVKDGFYCD
jgi:hypothetical protein